MWTVKLINLLLVLGNLCLELTSNRLHSHLRDAHLCRVHLLSYALLWNLPRSGEKYLLRHMLVFCSSNAPFFFCLSQCFWPGVSLPWSGCGAFFFFYYYSFLSPCENFHEVLERNMLSSSYPTTFSLFWRKCFLCIVGYIPQVFQ